MRSTGQSVGVDEVGDDAAVVAVRLGPEVRVQGRREVPEDAGDDVRRQRCAGEGDAAA